ncbi:MAG: ABC transporter substrate-binding protein [Bryobacterales bacterium]|nr:ABC transporter substrate-binding protein [Bryobacterales bacterium]
MIRCLVALGVLVLSGLAAGEELRFCLRADPKTFDPALVADEYSFAVQYLTGGVLVRFNRRTQAMEPELATSWKVDQGGRRITLQLRQGVRFSDGTPFTAQDVIYTIRRLLDPALHSPIGDSFRSGAGELRAESKRPDQVVLTFPAPVVNLERLLDQVFVQSATSPLKEKAGLGPFVLKEYKTGAQLLFARNPQYWKRDKQGRALPYADGVRLSIQANRETELLRFERGEIDLINTLDTRLYDRLQKEMPRAVADLGPGLDSEFVWFNQAPGSPLPAYKKKWFTSAAFRRAVSGAINRADLCRLALNGHAVPAAGPISPANQAWFNRDLKPHAFDPKGSLQMLEKAGFRKGPGGLTDSEGHRVEFSLVTNAGNPARARLASLLEQDLAQLGIKINIVTLDMPSLLERISRTADYEACLLGFVNTDVDPNGHMNVLLSSASNHPWNPKQAKPATPWEAEIDALMQAQAGLADARQRKAKFDRVQRILWEQTPIVYLLHKNYLVAVSPNLQGADPRPLAPQTYWNIEWIAPSGTRTISQR